MLSLISKHAFGFYESEYSSADDGKLYRFTKISCRRDLLNTFMRQSAISEQYQVFVVTSLPQWD